MHQPPIPANEAERLQALRLLDILDTAPEDRFDRITRVAQRLFDVPIALVSLVDAQRQWFKSRQGLDACETPRGISFCGHAILDADILHVPDATQDARFADNPLVTAAPGIRFYAGAPLRAPGGERVGTLCIIDRRPRRLDAGALAALRDLADTVEDELARVRLTEAMATVRAHEERLRAVLANVAEAIVTADAQGRVLSVNASANTLFDQPTAALVGTDLHRLLPRFSVAQCADLLRQDTLEGQSPPKWTHLTVARRADGTEVPVYLTVTLLRQQPDIAYIASVRDISDAERLELMKREFVSIVSHELRTPLTSIRGSLGLIKAGAVGAIPHKVGEMLGIAERNCERLINLVNDILDLEKIELGRLTFQFEDLPLWPVIESAVTLNKEYAAGFDVRLATACALPDDLRMRIDSDRLLQVLTNLISNAVKFSPRGGVVDIGAELGADGRSVRIGVRDRGPGIPADMREHIFEKFRQLESPGALSKGGTGLGLSISRAIVQAFGGSIGVECPADGGSLFRIELPLGADGSVA